MKTPLVAITQSVAQTALRLTRGWCLVLMTLLALAPSAWSTTETLTGSGNWTVPSGVTSVTVEMWGGGGGGGGKQTASLAGAGGGGGGGGYTRQTIATTPGGSIAYSVGAGGTAGSGTGPTDGAAGGSTTFVGATTAGGGGGGGKKSDATVPTGGAGGTGATANGGAGAAGSTSNSSGGPGGGAAGWNGSAGVAGGAGSVSTGGTGGGTAPSQGGNGGNSANGSAGSAGSAPGGGGGAGRGAGNVTPQNGAAGAAGSIVLTYTAVSAEPTLASSAMNFTGVADTSMTVNWTSGDGARRIVIAKAGSAPSGAPADLTQYTANATYASGQALAGGYVVYDGAGSSVTVSGLTGSTTYYFDVYEYNWDGSSAATINYLTSSFLSGSQATAASLTPTINVVGSSLAFGSVTYNTVSSEQSFSVSGINLTADISVTAPAGFEVSTTSGSGFGSSLNLTQSGGTVSSTTIYVRFAPTAVQAYSANVANASTGAPTVNVAVTGTGLPNLPTVSITAATDITNTSATLHGSIDSNGGGTISDRGFYYGSAPGITTSSTKASGSASWSTPGSYVWTVPAGVTDVTVELWGGGGGSGAKVLTGQAGRGAGGGGGGYSRQTFTGLTTGQTFNFTVGAGGSGGTISPSVNGGAGGNTTFDGVTTAGGGGGGGNKITSSVAPTGGTAGTGGTANGGAGENGGATSQANGAGGGAGGWTGAAGQDGGAGSVAVGGTGGGTGSSKGGNGGSGAGAAGGVPGGGSSGGSAASAGTSAGVGGAAGKVLLTFSGPGAVPIDLSLTGLTPNAATYYRAFAVNEAGTTLSSESSVFTLASVPVAPSLSTNAAYSPLTHLTIKINSDGNPADTEYAIQETNSGLYLQANNVLGAGAVWKTTNTVTGWHTFLNNATPVTLVSNLTAGTSYGFQVKARNNDSPQVPTVFGPATSRYTFPDAPTASNDGPVCEGSTVILTASAVTGGATNNWTGPNGFATNTPSLTVSIPNVTAAAAGTYSVTATTPDGRTSLTAGTTSVTVNPAATANAGPDQTVNHNVASVTLAGSFGGSATSATWSGGAGTFTPDANTPTATYAPTLAEKQAGTVTLTLTTDDPGGPCGAAIDSMTITLTNAAPVAQSFSTSVQQGNSISVLVIGGKYSPTDADGDALSIVSVSAGQGNVGTDGSSINYTNTGGGVGTYDSLTFTVADAYGGTNSAAVAVLITSATGANLVSATAGGGNAYLSYAGIPGNNYALDKATSITPPITWEPQVTNTANGSGQLNYTNLLSTWPTNDFFRTRHVP